LQNGVQRTGNGRAAVKSKLPRYLRPFQLTTMCHDHFR